MCLTELSVVICYKPVVWSPRPVTSIYCRLTWHSHWHYRYMLRCKLAAVGIEYNYITVIAQNNEILKNCVYI